MKLPISLALCVSLAGCAVHQPYINPAELESSAQFSSNPALYAKKLRSEYYSALQEHAQWRTATTIGSAGLLARAGYLAGTGSSNSNQIAALAIGAGSLYAVDGILYKNIREAIYAEGIKAVNCVEALYGANTNQAVALDKYLTEGRRLMLELEQKVPLAKTDKANAKSDLQTLISAIELARLNLGQSGHRYYNALSRVNQQVTLELTKVQPTPASVREALQGLGSYPVAPTSSPDTVAELDPAQADKNLLMNALKGAQDPDELAREQANQWNADVALLKAQVTPYLSVQQQMSPEHCDIEQQVKFAVAMPRTEDGKFDITQGNSISLPITSGSGSYNVYLITQTDNSPSLYIESINGKYIGQIKTTGSTTKADYSGLIRDEVLNREVRFDFEVK